jgi:hypothetical protein
MTFSALWRFLLIRSESGQKRFILHLKAPRFDLHRPRAAKAALCGGSWPDDVFGALARQSLAETGATKSPKTGATKAPKTGGPPTPPPHSPLSPSTPTHVHTLSLPPSRPPSVLPSLSAALRRRQSLATKEPIFGAFQGFGMARGKWVDSAQDAAVLGGRAGCRAWAPLLKSRPSHAPLSLTGAKDPLL